MNQSTDTVLLQKEALFAEEARTRHALLHMLEELQHERDVVRQAKQHWLDTVDAIDAPLLVHDEEFRVVRANRAYARQAGLGFEEIIGRPYWECFPRIAQAQQGIPAQFELPGGESFAVRSFPIREGGTKGDARLHLFENVTDKLGIEDRIRTLQDISASRFILDGEVEAVAGLITEAAARVTGVARANVWLFNAAETKLQCIDLYEAKSATHSSGMVLREREFANEFAALKSAPYVDANEPLTDPRTAGYVESYLKPLGITSVLDMVIEVSGKRIGLLCLEHVGRPHRWQPHEIAFAARLADKFAVAVTNRRKLEAQAAMERRERYYRKLIEGSADAFFVVDQAGRLVYRSESGMRLTGHKAEDVMGKVFFTFVVPESVDEARRALGEVIAQPDKPSRAELRIVRADGQLLDVEATGKNQLADPDVNGIVVIARDISARKKAERKLRRLNRALQTLSAGNEALVRATDEAGLLKEMVRVLGEVGGYPIALIGYAVDDAHRSIDVKVAAGFDPAALQPGISWGDNEFGQSAVGRAVRLGSTQVIGNVKDDPRVAFQRKILESRNAVSIVGLPLRMAPAERPFGAIGVATADPGGFAADELKLLEELAGDLAYGIANLRAGVEQRAASEKLRRSLEGTIGAVAATMESRDPYTAGHQRRVADLAAAIAREMGLPASAVEGIHFGALIHDLGKIQVPAEILSKPTRLSKLEFDLIKEHASAGYAIIKGIEFPWPIALMVLQHHERLDGSGYPQGLKGEAIALEARILAVADVVEAMSSHRPYRAGLGIEAALGEIEQKRGTWFEPAAVDACLRLFREQRFSMDAA